MKCTEYELSVILLPLAIAGGSATVTLIGTPVVHNAGVVAGVV